MQIFINNKSGDPIYDQIYSQIKSQIISGALKEDEPLPSIRSLAKDLGISVITTKRAYDELENSGFIITLLTGALVAYLANRADKIATDLGGKIDDSFGKQFGGDVKKLWNNVSGWGKSVIKTVRGKK